MIKDDITETIEIQRKSKGSILNEQIENAVRSAIRKTLKHEINKSPIIIVNVEKAY
jgi:ribonuclease J